jgi:hypothetical protein
VRFIVVVMSVRLAGVEAGWFGVAAAKILACGAVGRVGGVGITVDDALIHVRGSAVQSAIRVVRSSVRR